MERIKRLMSFIIVIALCMQFAIITEAKAQRATQDVDYVITYQYFNVYQERTNVYYQAIIEIQNISAGNLYLDSGVFDIYDAAGNIVASDDFDVYKVPDVIAPGEKGYFYSHYGLLDNLPMAQYTMIPTLIVEHSSLPVERFPVANVSIQDTKFYDFKTVGIIGNNTTEDEGYMYINAIYYNEADIPIYIDGTSITDVIAGQVKGFEIPALLLPNYISKENIAKVEVIAEPSQYQW